MNRLLIICSMWSIAGLGMASVHGEETPHGPTQVNQTTAALREPALTALRQTLEREQRWIKVHAAEHLLKLSYPQGVQVAFEAERATHEGEPKYRIGIWRVLAQAATSATERRVRVDRIRAVVTDPSSVDKVHALESLAKLNDRLDDAALKSAVIKAAQPDQPTTVYARWLLAGDGSQEHLRELASLLKSKDTTVRLVTAYALQWLRPTDPEVVTQLRTAAEMEPADSPAKVYLLSAAWLLTPTADAAAPFRSSLVSMAMQGGVEAHTVASEALATRGTQADVEILAAWLGHPNADVQAAAAAGLLRIDRRGTYRLGGLDWGVIGLYFVAMLAIGWFYSFHTRTSDDYLLGGRQMKPWAVGLSLFATLCSTISYLSTPGEMIQHGPMYFTSIAAYPVVTLVIGWWLIPYFMKLPVTSAYEILESRLGLGVRLLGAVFFLAMRLLWMALILDITTNVVLLPLLGLDRSYAPYLCALIGLTTVVYSSMGGIRAVVMTDVVQTFVLLGGAIAALGLITWQLGGVGQWWPTSWAPNWDPPVLGLDPYSRMSLAGVFVSTFFWYLCTAGSDQMAIQRYLATRDVKSARRMFNISMIAGVVVTVLLALLGMALLSWFRSHPEMLAEGQSIAHHGDQLFPRFIVAALPDGVSGLVVAGLLAAAMSSLSSGLSSSSAVIAVDYFDRFSRRSATPPEQVRRARYISWCVGIAVVLLSTVVGMVQGNVLEVAFKVVNLLVAPLFGLFFMALFVRQATSFGTFVGAAAGLATVVAISYWTEFTGRQGISFLWSMPVGLFVQIGVGWVASLLPIGVAKPLVTEQLSFREQLSGDVALPIMGAADV